MLEIYNLLRWLLIAYVIYLAYRFFKKLITRTPPPPHKPSLSGMMVKDEICNTYVPKEEAIREVFTGKEYFFCSKECRTKFLEQGKNRG